MLCLGHHCGDFVVYNKQCIHLLLLMGLTNLLHFLCIFIMARVLSWHDVINFGKAFLILALPMTWVVAQQFQADAQDIINTAAGGTGFSIGNLRRKSESFWNIYFCQWNCFLLLFCSCLHHLWFW